MGLTEDGMRSSLWRAKINTKWKHSIIIFFSLVWLLSHPSHTLLVGIILPKQRYCEVSRLTCTGMQHKLQLAVKATLTTLIVSWLLGRLCLDHKSVDICHAILADPISTPLLLAFLPRRSLAHLCYLLLSPSKRGSARLPLLAPFHVISNLYWVLGKGQEWCKVLYVHYPI